MKESTKSLLKESTVGVIKGSIGAIPYAGTLLNEILFDIRSRVKQQRTINFLNKYSESLEKLDAEAKLKNKSENVDFTDFFEFILKIIANNRFNEKIDIFKNILLNATINESIDIDYYQIFTDEISNLTFIEIVLLENYYQSYSKDCKNEDEIILKLKSIPLVHLNVDSGVKIFGLSFPELKLAAELLIRKGILFDISYGFTDANPLDRLTISDYGISLIIFLNQHKTFLMPSKE